MTVQRYNAVAMTLHWVIAALIIFNIIIAQGGDDVKTAADIAQIQLHKSIGITVLLLTLARILTRLFFKAPPAEVMKPVEALILKGVHVLFYALMIGIPLTGWLLVSMSPRNIPTFFFDLFQWPHLPIQGMVGDPKEATEEIAEIHETISNGILVLAALHVLAALKHHFIAKDSTLFRMLPAACEGFLRRLRGEKA